MPDNIQSDIDFQPETKSFSYSTAPQEKKKRLSIIIALLFVFILLPLLLLITLFVLNYYNFISLSTLSPIFKTFPKSQQATEPKPNNISGTNQYEIEGVFEKYDQNTVGIKFGNKILTMEYTLDSQFYYSKTIINNDLPTPAAEIIAIIDFPSNILKQENLGKRVLVQYRIEKNRNILQTLTLNR